MALPERPLAFLLALASAASAVQFTFLLEPLGSLTRRQRVEILAAGAAVALLWFLLTLWLERRGGRRDRGVRLAGKMAVTAGE
jgi:hypothetical protein